MNICDRLLHFAVYYTAKIFLSTGLEDPLACHGYKFPASLVVTYKIFDWPTSALKKITIYNSKIYIPLI
ncbi:hypothetical protein Hanom_Chr04g00285741 [Helianthus anomalus]